MNVMKICQITSMHDWDDDRIFQRACLGLARKGLEVHLVATRPDKIPVVKNINFHWINKRSGWKKRWISSKEAVEKAIEIKADIYHFHDPDLLPHVTRINKKYPDAKIIYDIHENYTVRFAQWKITKRFDSFFGRLFRNYEIRKIKKISGYTVTTKSMHFLFNDSGKPWLDIRNTVDINRIKQVDIEGDKFNEPVVYTSGTNSDARNVMETVLSFPSILENYPNTKMMFVGGYQDDLEQRIKNFTSKNNIRDKLIIDGMLPWEENFKRTSKAFCGCVFYEDNPNNKVTLPNRLYEYMYCGIPVVATDFPELRNIIEDTKCGILVDSEDPKSIAKGILHLLNNPELANKMGKSGKKAIENTYGYHIDLENTIKFYRKLIES